MQIKSKHPKYITDDTVMCNYTEIRICNSGICSEPYGGILIEYVDIHKTDKQAGFHVLK